MEVAKTLNEKISKYCLVTLETFAYAGTGNVLKVGWLPMFSKNGHEYWIHTATFLGFYRFCHYSLDTRIKFMSSLSFSL